MRARRGLPGEGQVGAVVAFLASGLPLPVLGCAGVLKPLPPVTDAAAAVKALRVLIEEPVAIVAEGEVPPGVDKTLVAALQAELGRAGLEVVGSRKRQHDLRLRLDTRVRGLPLFLHGYVTATVRAGDAAVEVLSSGEELHRATEFAPLMARRLARAFVGSPAIAAFARRRAPPAQPVVVPPAPPRPPERPAEDAVARARQHSRQGTALYNLNRFQGALREYEASYLAAPDPALLFNIAQCHRKLGRRAEAIDFYRTYLRNAPHAPNRAEVERRIDELQTASDPPPRGAPVVK
jgi:tetratricopeptide (TPR) repeat protein